MLTRDCAVHIVLEEEYPVVVRRLNISELGEYEDSKSQVVPEQHY
jgi:hypothetical protein